ncbi:hypothetical protein ACMFMG_010964 [Clarireedia jacksonii]
MHDPDNALTLSPLTYLVLFSIISSPASPSCSWRQHYEASIERGHSKATLLLQIVPSTAPTAPILPHFIVEIKGPTGSLEVVKRQAAHAGAVAAYATFSLENYGVDNPIYDDNTVVHVWTYTSVPDDLTHYGMRIHRPDPDTEPSYHLTLVKTYHITESHEQYRKGVSAFRHCRDDSHKKIHERLAKAIKRLRNSTTPQLNEQASQSNMPA